MSNSNANDLPSDHLFTVGRRVRSRVTAQGLRAGRCYTVEMTNQMRNSLGTFTTASVRDGEEVHHLKNPHMALQEVGPDATDEPPIPATPAEPRFHNGTYAITAERTSFGHQILHVIAENPAGPFATRRKVAAFMYELAADMERQSELLGASWMIGVDVESANVFIRLRASADAARAEQFAADVIASYC
jgi:hypothetical protein